MDLENDAMMAVQDYICEKGITEFDEKMKDTMLEELSYRFEDTEDVVDFFKRHKKLENIGTLGMREYLYLYLRHYEENGLDTTGMDMRLHIIMDTCWQICFKKYDLTHLNYMCDSLRPDSSDEETDT
jgi:hypothetical protein